MNYQKFVVFVVALLTIVALGVTVYYFMKDDEFINLQTNEINVNVGDTFKLSYQHDNPLDSTEIEWVIQNTDLITYDSTTNEFTAIAAGETEIWLETNRSGWTVQQCYVRIGDGSNENPFIISSAEQLYDGLENIAEGATANSSYILVADLDMSNADEQFTPLFSNSAFGGEFNGNGHSISNLTINSSTRIDYAGLFSRIASTGYVHDLVLNNVVMSGQLANVGAVAGENRGLIEKVQINFVTLSSTLDSDTVRIGSIAGQSNAIFDTTSAGTNYNLIGRIDRCEVFNANLQALRSTNIIGGLTAVLNGGVVINSSFNGLINSSVNGAIGAGIVAYMNATENSNAKLKDNYAVVRFENVTNKAGIVYNNDFSEYTNAQNQVISENVIWGQYFDATVCADPTVNAIQNKGYTNQDTYNQRVQDKVLVAMGATTDQIKNGLREGYIFTADPENPLSASQYTGVLSHVKFANNAAIQAYSYDFATTWQQSADVNDGYPTLKMQGKADDYFININGEVETEPDEPDEPTPERTLHDMLSQCQDGETISLAEDYDWEGNEWLPIGTEDNPFNGTFDGRGHTISNIVISGGGANEVGIFGVLGESAVIKNVTFENVTVTSGQYVGIVAGINNGTIENVDVTNTNSQYEGVNVNTNRALYAGGIVGLNNGSINYATSDVAITTNTSANVEFRVGGIAGQNDGYIYDAGSTSNINSHSNNNRVGGIVGYNQSSVEYTAFRGAITGVSNNNNYAGGVVGYNRGNITTSSAQATITAYNVGGLAGYSTGTLTKNNVYNTQLTGERVGGLIAMMQSGTMTNCSAVVTLIGQSDSSIKGGFATYVIGSTNSSGQGDCARIDTCFVAATFQGQGTNYAETSSLIRISLVGTNREKQAGFIVRSIYDDDVDGDAEKQGTSKAVGGIFGDLFNNPNKGTNDGLRYDNLDGRTSTNDCMNSISPFTTDNRNFDYTNVWSLGNGQYPTIRDAKTI